MIIAHDIKPKRILNFYNIIQSWARNEDKNVDIESIEKQLKIRWPICVDEIRLEASILCGHIFCHECIYGVINAQINVLFVDKNLV